MPDTGAPYFIPYVEPTDLVRDYPDASEDLALAIVAALENIPVTEKRIEAFTGSGNWTVPAGVTYAIAHILGGGGGAGTSGGAGGNGGVSSVDFASGLVAANGGTGGPVASSAFVADKFTAGQNNGGRGVKVNIGSGFNYSEGLDATYIVAAADVTPAAVIAVVVGAGGTTSGGTAPGGSGYVYIEYYEEV